MKTKTGQTLASKIAHIAGTIGSEHFPTGDRAVLRRMNPSGRSPLPLAFYRFASHHLEDWHYAPNDWVAIVAGIAIMSPGAYDPSRSLGKVLAETRYSEARLERLLASEGNTRRTLLLRAARFLATKNMAFNWTDAAQLLLTTEPEKLERLHRRIAHDFYSSI